MTRRGNLLSRLVERFTMQALAFCIWLIVIVLMAALLITTGGNLNDALWSVLYIGLALITGIAFWIVTPGAKSEVGIPKLGIKLAGSAATGAAFIIIVNFYLPPRDYAITTLPLQHQDKSFHQVNPDDSMKVTRINLQRYLVEFVGNKRADKFRAEQLTPDGQAWNSYEFTVDMNWKIKDIRDITER